MVKHFIILCFILSVASYTIAQVPTVQDCMGAIPICQNVYTQNNAYSGAGHYSSEINPNISCLDQEYYSVWYTFTAQTSGFFRFAISPNNSYDDYDWQVFDLTNATCAQIYSNQSLSVSCNSWGSYGGVNGATGASNAQGGSGNWNGPGDMNGPPWNSDIPVVAGHTYKLLICNWSESTSGYSINFSGSSATIFDNVKPRIDTALAVLCGEQQVRIRFSEMVLCNSVQASDFVLNGPNGIIPITAVTGNACSLGGNQEINFILQTAEHLQKGSYTLTLNPTASGSVNDLCGNMAEEHSVMFSIIGLDIQLTPQDAICSPNGKITVAVNGGLSPYQYTWSNGDSGSPLTGLSSGNYQVTITDSRSCVDSSQAIVSSSSSDLIFEMLKQDARCFDSNDGRIDVTVSQGQTPFNFQWSDGSILQNRINLTPAWYIITVTDANGCSSLDSVQIDAPDQLEGHIVEIIDEVCSFRNGEAEILIQGGVQPYSFQWGVSGFETSTRIIGRSAGNYTVVVTDSLNCTLSIPYEIGGMTHPTANFIANPWRTLIDNPEIDFINLSLYATISEWDFGDGTTSTDESPTHSYTEVGFYPVRLIVSSGNDCVDTVVKTVEIYDNFYLWLPNAFSPNNDGLNDLFGPEGVGYTEDNYEFLIFNRWGELVFKTNTFSEKWDGKMENEFQYTSNIYVWRILINDKSGRIREFIGNVLMIR